MKRLSEEKGEKIKRVSNKVTENLLCCVIWKGKMKKITGDSAGGKETYRGFENLYSNEEMKHLET